MGYLKERTGMSNTDFGGTITQNVKNLPGSISNTLSQVDDKIIQPVNNTVDMMVRDPKLLVAVAISVYAPGAGSMIGQSIGLSGTAATVAGNAIMNTALNGGDVKAGVISALVPVIGGEVASKVGNELIKTGMDKIVATTLGSVSGSMAAAIITGGDVKAAAYGGLAANVPAILGSNSTFASLPKPVQATLAAGVAASVTGKDVNAAMLAA